MEEGMAAMIAIERLELPGVFLIRPRRFSDPRGYFIETYSRREFRRAGIAASFVQDNESYSAKAGTIRGIHYQIQPYAQDKLVRVQRGAVLDVVVDLRIDLPSFGEHATVRLDAQSATAILVPTGFGHAMCTLEDDTIVLYKVSAAYSPAHERGIAWNDPLLAIDWPVAAAAAIVSDRDRNLPLLENVPRGDLFQLRGSEPAHRAAAEPAAVD